MAVAAFVRKREFRVAISEQWLRGVHESVAERNTITKGREHTSGIAILDIWGQLAHRKTSRSAAANCP